MSELTFNVTGMHCDGCAGRLQKLLAQADGVKEADVSFSAGTARTLFDAAKIDEEALRLIVADAGFKVA